MEGGVVWDTMAAFTESARIFIHCLRRPAARTTEGYERVAQASKEEEETAVSEEPGGGDIRKGDEMTACNGSLALQACLWRSMAGVWGGLVVNRRSTGRSCPSLCRFVFVRRKSLSVCKSARAGLVSVTSSKNPSSLPGTSVLPWVPDTTAAITLRMIDLDYAVSCVHNQKERNGGNSMYSVKAEVQVRAVAVKWDLRRARREGKRRRPEGGGAPATVAVESNDAWGVVRLAGASPVHRASKPVGEFL